MRYLSAAQIVAIHEQVILPNELQGMAQNKSIDAVVARLENRLAYGLMGDVFDLAACYLCYVAVGYCFHDANKRTAHTAMQLVLRLNGVTVRFDVEEMGGKVISAAQGKLEDEDIAQYLRSSVVSLEE